MQISISFNNPDSSHQHLIAHQRSFTRRCRIAYSSLCIPRCFILALPVTIPAACSNLPMMTLPVPEPLVGPVPGPTPPAPAGALTAFVPVGAPGPAPAAATGAPAAPVAAPVVVPAPVPTGPPPATFPRSCARPSWCASPAAPTAAPAFAAECLPNGPVPVPVVPVVAGAVPAAGPVPGAPYA